MLITLNFSSQKPIYEQLYEQIILAMANGTLKSGDSLPAVRTLAEEIGINLHTVNKAYNILKDEGYVNIDRRKGAVVAVIPIVLRPEYKNELIDQLELLIAKAHLMGLEESYIIDTCKNHFKNYKEELR